MHKIFIILIAVLLIFHFSGKAQDYRFNKQDSLVLEQFIKRIGDTKPFQLYFKN